MGRERSLLLAVVLVAVALFAVARFGSELAEGESYALDKWLLLALRDTQDLSQPLGPSWLKPMFVDFTALGGTPVLTLFTVAAIGYLLAAKRVGEALFLATATGSGAILGKLLKYAFARPRPDIVPHLIEVNTASFPSGHTVNSAIVCLTIGGILARGQSSRSLAVYIMSAAFALTALIGISRVYLGVHYPSDVLAGWAVGGTWALLCVTIARRFQPDRKIVTSTTPTDLSARLFDDAADDAQHPVPRSTAIL